jgi:hypothetical protein
MIKDNGRPVLDLFLRVVAVLPDWGFVLLALVFGGIGWLLVDAGYAHRDGIGLLMMPIGAVSWVAALTCLSIIIPVRDDRAGPLGW